MTVTLPTNGKADWTNYVDYWRDEDASWIQDRLVLRVGSDAERNAVGFGTTGAVVYNATRDALELRKAAGWSTLNTLPAMINVNEDTTNSITTLSHTGAGGRGIVYSASQIAITNKLNVMNGVLTVDGPAAGGVLGVYIKTGTKTAKLTTDATYLVSDTPVSMPGIQITGSGIIDAVGKSATIGTLSLTTLQAPGAGALTVNATTLNATSASVGGVGISSNRVTASSGMVSNQGLFYGDSNGAVMRHVNGTGPYVQTTTGGVVLSGGGTVDLYSQPRLINIGAIQHWNTGRNIAPSFYSATDPGAGNFADGTIWIS